MGKRSTNGAHTNLKEYPSAAQLKYVTSDFLMPASSSQIDSEEKISMMGRPAENPRNNIVYTLGFSNAAKLSRQEW